MSRLLHWYGASPLHLLTMTGSFALAGYAAAELLPVNAVGILIWFVAAVVGHDLLLMPLYTLADRSATAVFRHRPLKLPAGPWINYLRVPAALSGVLLLIWFPLIFQLPGHFTASTTLPLSPYLWHWLAVTGTLFLLSATALALRLGAAHRRVREEPASSQETADPAADVTPDRPVPPEPAHQPGQVPEEETPEGSPEGSEDHALEDVTPPAIPDPATTPIGTILPDTELLDVRGGATTLYSAAGNSAAVLVFYQGTWCRDCDSALSSYRQQLLPQLARRGIRLIVISPQQPDASLTMQQSREPAFTVVSDPGNTVAGRLGLRTQPSAEVLTAQLRRGLDLTRVNADGTVTLPMPAVVILDASHTVRWIDVHPDHRTRTEIQQVISALDHLEH